MKYWKWYTTHLQWCIVYWQKCLHDNIMSSASRFARFWAVRTMCTVGTMGTTCTTCTVVAYCIIIHHRASIWLAPLRAGFYRCVVWFVAVPSTSALLTKTPGIWWCGSTFGTGMCRGVAWRRPGTYIGGRSRFCTSDTPPIECRRRSVRTGLTIVDVSLIGIGSVRFEEAWPKGSFLALLFVFSCEQREENLSVLA